MVDGRILEVTLDDGDAPPLPYERDQERRIAIYDLVESASLSLVDPAAPAGPYRLRLALKGRGLALEVFTEAGAAAASALLPLAPFRRIVKDYLLFCESYAEAARKLSSREIEEIDTARRASHDEGAKLLRERLAATISLETDAARRLFTLLAAMQYRG